MNKNHFLMAAVLGLAMSVPTHAGLSSLFGTSTKEYVTRLGAVVDIQNTINDMNKINKDIMDKEKALSVMSKDLHKDASAKITQLEGEITKLYKDAKDQADRNIADLKSRIETRNGNIAQMQEALKAEGSLSSYAQTANKYAFGYLGAIVNVTQSWDTVGKEQIEKNITSLKQEIAKLENEISKAQDSVRTVLTSPEHAKAVGVITTDLNMAKKTLADLSNVVAQARKTTIFDVHNNNADLLIKNINQSIKDAKCDKIKNMGDAKNAALDACKIVYLGKIKEKGKNGLCTSLQLTSTKEDINKCKATL